MKRLWKIAPAVLLSSLVVGGCATLQQIVALRQVNFTIAGVGEGRLLGIDLAGLQSAADIGAQDLARVAGAVANGNLPLEFVVNIRAENPAENSTAAEMIRLQWTLLLDDRETIDGVIEDRVLLAPGDPTIIPVAVRLDLMEFFAGTAPELVGLALRFAGAESDAAEVKLRAVPTVDTPFGLIDYPATIMIVRGDDDGS